jgi:hypothetical protein
MESVEMGLCFTLARSRGEEWSGWCVPDMIFLTAHHEDIAAAAVGRTQVLELRLYIILFCLWERLVRLHLLTTCILASLSSGHSLLWGNLLGKAGAWI